ncbi:MAG: hypothetical protein JXA99_09240 [Candidatus Lokiarchaeota archaeon]|nr:hypothetical protein [Candidatus Lokiarchaeota archaeon]
MIDLCLQKDILIVKIKKKASKLGKLYLDIMMEGESNDSKGKSIHLAIFKQDNDVFLESNMLTMIINENI